MSKQQEFDQALNAVLADQYLSHRDEFTQWMDGFMQRRSPPEESQEKTEDPKNRP